MESFKASVQYGDWEGTAAADDAHQTSLTEYFRGKGQISTNEFLIAASLYVSEGFTNVRAFVFQKEHNFESVRNALAAIARPIPVREVDVKLTPEEFIGLFKRFYVMLTRHGLQLEGRDYSVIGRSIN
jgi:hypothetical protein